MTTTRSQTKNICYAAVALASVFVVTRFIQIPIPLGYFNIGNTVILAFCMLLPTPYGIAAASLGSALADLTSYPVYTLPTLIIKALFPLIFYVIVKKNPASAKRQLVAAAVSTLIPLFGYTITGAIIYGSFYTGLAQFPGLFLEYVANFILFTVLRRYISKISL